MSVVRILRWIGVSVLFVALALILHLSFGDLGWIRPRAEAAISKATGREFEIAGGLSLDVLPTPSLVAEKVTLTNAEWGSDPLMVKVEHLSVRVELWSLVSGPIRIEEVRLRDVEVLLETNADGEVNWKMGSGEAPGKPVEAQSGESEKLEIPGVVDLGEIRNVVVTIRGPEEKEQVVTIESLDIETAVGQLALEGHGQIDDFPWRLSGLIGAWDSTDDPLRPRIEAALGDLELNIAGQVTNSPMLEGTELTLDVSSEELGPVLEMLDIPLAISGPLRIAGEVAILESNAHLLTADIQAGEIEAHAKATFEQETIDFEVTISELDKIGTAMGIDGLPPERLTLAGHLVNGATALELNDITALIGETTARVSGSVATGPEGGTEVSVEVAGPSLAQLTPTLPAIPFSVKTSVEISPQQLAVDPLNVTFGDSDLSGSLAIQTAETKAITGRVRSQFLDLTPFSSGPESKSEGAVPAGDGGEAQTAAAEPDAEMESEWVLGEEPLPLDALQTTTTDLAFEIGEFVTENVILRELSGSVSLDQGRLALETRFQAPAGGDVVADVNLDGAAETPTLKMTLYARDLKMNVGAVDPENIPILDMTLEIESAGSSPRALASSANGHALLTVGPGQIENSSVGFLSNDFISEFFGALNPVSEKSEYSRLDCAVVAAGIEDGLMEFGTLFIQSETLMVLGVGDIDLNTEKLNLEFNTKPREGVGISVAGFVTPFVKLSGTLAEPGMGLDTQGVLVSGGLAVATGGMSMLFKGATDRATAGGDRCEEVRAAAGQHPSIGN